MISMQNLGCSTAAGSLAALGSTACLVQAGKAVNNAIQDGGSKTSMQRGLDSLLGEATGKTSHVARNVFEGALYTAGAVVLGGVAANIFDPSGNAIPTSIRPFSGCSEAEKGTFDGVQEMLGSLMSSLQNVSLTSIVDGGSSVASIVYNSTLGAASYVGDLVSENPLTTGVLFVGIGGARNRAPLLEAGTSILGAGSSLLGRAFSKPQEV